MSNHGAQSNRVFISRLSRLNRLNCFNGLRKDSLTAEDEKVHFPVVRLFLFSTNLTE